MKAFLFYLEEDTFILNQRTLIDQWCAMAGLTHLVVDKTGFLKQTNNNIFSSLQDAIDAHPECTWVFLSPHASQSLKDFTHPETDVIYCVGSDSDGFQDVDISKYQTIKLQREDGSDNSWYASTIVPIVIAHRMFRPVV